MWEIWIFVIVVVAIALIAAQRVLVRRNLPSVLFLIVFGAVIAFFGEIFKEILLMSILYSIGILIISFGTFFLVWKLSTSVPVEQKKPRFLVLVVWAMIFAAAGLSASILSGGINNYFLRAGVSEDLASNTLAPLIEEATKAVGVGIVVLGHLSKKKSKNIFLMLIAGGLIIGLTFGLSETLGNENYLGNFFGRLLKTIPQHGLWTVIMAVSFWFPLIKYPKKWVGLMPFISTYFFVVAWHSLWNQSTLIEPLKRIALPILALLVLFIIVKQFVRRSKITKMKLSPFFAIFVIFLILIIVLFFYVAYRQDQAISLLAVVIAILTFCIVVRQTELVRRTLYGEIYEKPPLKSVGFLKLKAKHDERVRFSQPIGGDIFEEVILPKNSKIPLLIIWRTREKQSLRNLQFGFELGHNRKPRVVKKLSGWVVKNIKPLQTGEYIDLDGYYHIEYSTPRKFGKESSFIVEFEIETGSTGNYDFHIEVYSEEAKESFKKTLKVIVE